MLSYDALGCYEVVKEHSGPLPVLMSASDTEMECLGLVDIRVKFGKLGPVVLQQVLVCRIGFNVISSWQASRSGWCSWFTAAPGESCLVKYSERGSCVWVPLVTEARSWWAMAQEIGSAKAKAKVKSKGGVPQGTPPKFRKDDGDTGDAMEVDRAKEKAHPNKHPHRALEVTPFKFLLRAVSSDFECDFFFDAEVGSEAEVVPAVCLEECCEGFAVGSEVCVSSAAVLLKQASTTHNEASRRSGRSEGLCVSVGAVPPMPQSEVSVGAGVSEASGRSGCALVSEASGRSGCALVSEASARSGRALGTAAVEGRTRRSVRSKVPAVGPWLRFQFFLLVLLTVRGTSRAAPEHVDAWFCLGFPGGSNDGDERADQRSAGDGECSQQSEGVSSSQVGAFRGSRSATGAGGTVSNVGRGWEGALDERVPWFNATLAACWPPSWGAREFRLGVQRMLALR